MSSEKCNFYYIFVDAEIEKIGSGSEKTRIPHDDDVRFPKIGAIDNRKLLHSAQQADDYGRSAELTTFSSQRDPPVSNGAAPKSNATVNSPLTRVTPFVVIAAP
jgi:hypothetical protein